jgi:hypothetical protein
MIRHDERGLALKRLDLAEHVSAQSYHLARD